MTTPDPQPTQHHTESTAHRDDIVQRLHLVQATAHQRSVRRIADEAADEIERLRQRVLDLKAPPRGVGGQVITLADTCPTYSDLLAHCYRTDEQLMAMASELHRLRAAAETVVAEGSADAIDKMASILQEGR